MADPVWVDDVTPLNSTNLTKLQTRDEKAAANGYPSLDGTGKVPLAQLPATGAALSYDGDYVPATTYNDGQVLIKDGIAYLCVGGPTTTAPDPVPWGYGAMGLIPASEKGAANGVATLGANGKVPAAQLPGVPYMIGTSNVVGTDGSGNAWVPFGQTIDLGKLLTIVCCNGDTYNNAVVGVYSFASSYVTSTQWLMHSNATGTIRVNWMALLLP